MSRTPIHPRGFPVTLWEIHPLPAIGARFHWARELADPNEQKRPVGVVVVASPREIVWRYEADPPDAPRRACLPSVFRRYTEDAGGGA